MVWLIGVHLFDALGFHELDELGDFGRSKVIALGEKDVLMGSDFPKFRALDQHILLATRMELRIAGKHPAREFLVATDVEPRLVRGKQAVKHVVFRRRQR